MGSFWGHMLPGTLFLFIGAWHVWAAIARYVGDPEGFRVRAWNPAGGGKIRLLELYVITAGAFIDIIVELGYATHLQYFIGPDHILNSGHMNNFEHGGMLIMFFLYGTVALLSEKTRFLPLPQSTLCLIGAVAFLAEYILFFYHSTTHQGLEGYYHLILVILISSCIATAVMGALFQTSLILDLSNGIFIMLQGLWFYATAATLYGPLLPRGCTQKDNNISCPTSESVLRGDLLANFQLFTLVFFVFVYVLGCYTIAALRFGHPDLKRMHEAEFAAIYSSEGADHYVPTQ